MIHVNFNTYNNYVTESLYQWDLNQDLIIYGLNLSVAPEIHFANANMERAIVRQSSLTDVSVNVRIPNSLLQEALPIKAYVGIYAVERFNVIETIEIPVIAKPRPSDYVLEDTDGEIYSFIKLENEIVNARTVISNMCADNVNVMSQIMGDRLNNLIAHNNDTEGNSELIDIRLGYDGILHPSAGEAVRVGLRKTSKNLVFETEEQLLTWVDGLYIRADKVKLKDCKQGDTFYILENNSAYWYDGTEVRKLTGDNNTKEVSNNILDGTKINSLYQKTEKDDTALSLGFSEVNSEIKEQIAGIYNKVDETGENATSLGTSIATGKRSLASGSSNLSTGKASITNGADNYNAGNNSAVFGYANANLNDNGFVGGSKNILRDTNQTAGGHGNDLTGHCATAFGDGLIVSRYGQMVIGTFNKPVTEALFIIGCGTSDTDRRNALVVGLNGQIYLKGSLNENFSGYVI